VLLAYHKLVARVRDSDEALMEAEAAEISGATVFTPGPPPTDEIAEWLTHLPPNAPENLMLIGCRPLFDEAQRRIRESWEDYDPLAELAADVRLEPLAADYVAIPEAQTVDERILLAAFAAHADVIVSDELASSSSSPTTYTTSEGGPRIVAMTFELFVAEYLGRPFAFDDVPGGLLPAACRLLQPPGGGHARFEE